MKNILLIGGAGYVGCQLTRKLINQNYNVIVYDLFLYDPNVLLDLNKHPNLKLIKGDIRNINYLENFLENIDVVIHLACISNDPSYELNPNLGKDINYSCFPKLLEKLKNFNIKMFIYASSSSVYGIKKENIVTENMSTEPLTDYSLYKLKCEELLFNDSAKYIKTVLRPATVCGYSERQRLDVIVNILTNHAFFNKKIIVHGGNQLRPNIHIDDMCSAYLSIIENKDFVNNEIFNIGFENHSVNELALLVKKTCSEVEIIIEKVLDERSYKISSEKILKKINFKTKKSVEDAVKDLVLAFSNKKLVNTFLDDKFYNIKIIQKKINDLIND
jgi:nucleoside-diphosphate-sugar epimerase